VVEQTKVKMGAIVRSMILVPYVIISKHCGVREPRKRCDVIQWLRSVAERKEKGTMKEE